jgi:hypothetical protein
MSSTFFPLGLLVLFADAALASLVRNNTHQIVNSAHAILEDSLGAAVTTKQRQRLRGQASNNKALLHFEEGGMVADNSSHIADMLVESNRKKVNGTQTPEPRIFFLFLTMSGIKRPELWRAFFDYQPVGRWRTFVHCKHSNICSLELSLGNILGATQVATVPSSYCRDLVTPMVQLLQAAMTESASPRDKFVFLSESTLPVKPFAEIYNALTVDTNSDFCVYPTDHWVELELAQNLHALIVKHSQWVVLNQAHAQAMVYAWPSVSAGLNGQSWSIPVYHGPKKGPWGKITNPAGVLPLPMCIDEWAFFSTIFGAFVDKGEWSMPLDGLPGFSAPPLQLRGAAHLTTTTQGTCRTFAFWDATEFGGSKLVSEIAQDWPYSKLSCFPRCDSTHPAEFAAISDRGVLALRRSRYLFARKFPENVMTVDQFQRIILPPPAPVAR